MSLTPARPPFLACRPDPTGARVVLYGLPFEGQVNQRRGAWLAPGQIRRASDLLETYAPALGADLTDLALADAGDVPLAPGPPGPALAAARAVLELVLDQRLLWVFLGGDHTVTACVVAAARRYHPELHVVQFDAHPDLRPAFGGEPWNYASAMTRVLDHLPPDRLHQVGLRAGAREEWVPPPRTRLYPAWVVPVPAAAARVAREVGPAPLYVTIDIDVLDPGVAPGTGSPEPGGIAMGELLAALRELAGTRVVGFDVVEVSPLLDPSGVTAVAAAALVRDAILTFWGKATP